MYEAAYGGDATQSTDPKVCGSALFGMTPLEIFLTTCFGLQLGAVRNINVVRASKPAS